MPSANSSSAAPPARKPAPPSIPATVILTPLKSCLTNLPASLVSVLVSQNTPAQNVVVELTVKGANGQPNRTAFAGWTGMQSKKKPTAGMQSRPGDDAVVEIDPALARNVGIADGAKVSVQLHIDPPMAHTIHIEPLTASDWEIIELHASFLELNLLSQIRCVTPAHPLSVYLSATSTASIKLQRVEPEESLAGNGFVKVSPDAEIIVAPKTRQRRLSRGAKSTTSTVRTSAKKKSDAGAGGKSALFLRGVILPYLPPAEKPEEAEEEEEFDEQEHELKTGGRAITVYLDPTSIHSRQLRGASRVLVSVVRPPALNPNKDPVQPPQQPEEKDKKDAEPDTVSKLIATVKRWDNAPDSKHVALSKLLAANLQLYEGEVGPMIRLEAAPPAIPHKSFMKVKIHPFKRDDKEEANLKWGGGTRRLEDMAIARLYEVLGPKRQRNGTKEMIEEDLASVTPGEGVLETPMTDGMFLPPIEDSPISAGAVLKLEATPLEGQEAPPVRWYMAGDKKPALELAVAVPKPSPPPVPETLFVPEDLEIVGVDATLDKITDNLLTGSSVLLSGAHGSGKTAMTRVIAQRLTRSPHFYRIIDTGTLSKIAEERVATVKENFNRWLSEATWMAGKTGRSVVLLDDLDRLCAAESENQDNSRVRQIAEVVVSILKKFTKTKSVVLLATCQAKESMHTHLIGSHVFRETIALKAMTKEGRRTVLEGLVQLKGDIDPDLDLRDIAARTEGYMPGDLALLVDRARHEAAVRLVETVEEHTDGKLTLRPIDFDCALDGFVPAGLRGVKLQTSGAAWKDIGGLHETRKILLETLEWPTKYAPIFASCPLRLRSGLLLYGYPGCGKTLLASAVAGECGLNFISVKGPEILNKYIGASEKSVRDLFERAQGAKPCVLFFDEFDSIAPKRGHDSTGVTDRVVNQMLTQMDGAEGLDGVYVLAATSRPDLIDPALLRPGRLDKSLLCNLPDLDERVDIIHAVGTKVHFGEDVDVREIAKRTEGYSGADLQAVVYNAHLEAVQGVIGEEIRRKEEMGEKKGEGEKEEDIEFLEFVWGDSKGKAKGVEGGTRAKGKERGQLVEKLTQLRKSAKSKPTDTTPAADEGAQEIKREIIPITWDNIETSLKTTRPSIAPEEQARLGKIYDEFVGARSGEMPNGQASTEVGGRSSLM